MHSVSNYVQLAAKLRTFVHENTLALTILTQLPTADDITAINYAVKTCDHVICLALADDMRPSYTLLESLGVDILLTPKLNYDVVTISMDATQTPHVDTLVRSVVHMLPNIIVLPHQNKELIKTLDILADYFGEVFNYTCT